MKILFVCTSYSVFGAEVLTLALLRELRERGQEVHAVVSLRQWGDGDFQDRLREMGVPCVELPLGFISKAFRFRPMLWTANVLVRLPVLWWRFWRLRRRLNPDVTVMNSPRHAILLWPLLDAKRTLLHIHSGIAPTPWNRRVWRWLERRLAACVAVSDFIGRNLVEAGLPPNKVVVVKNGTLDGLCGKQSAARPAMPPGNPVRVGIIGQIGAWKGHEDLVEAVQQLVRSGEGLTVRVFGGGDPAYVEQLKSDVRRRGLEDRFEWVGFERDTEKIFGSLDVCVVPSRFEEPFGLVAVEAGAAGLPVVATRRGGLPEIVLDGETGFLVDANAPDQLAARIGELIRDPLLRRRLGERARESVWSRFTRRQMAESFENLCARIAAAAVPRAVGGPGVSVESRPSP